ncbi:MAG: Holliday junction branch migration protein RuvA [Streptomycetaceae bacterium]|jgi:Holliday junction DNA helicase RuvA|nr:MAG: Holliday junction branch migration protein RuvA [Streptomycetaceae bacterium]
MISIVTGTVRAIHIDRLIVEVGGIGLSVLVNPATSSSVTLGSSVQLFTSLVVREDSLTLFGFLSEQARGFFELVQTVSGVGPKVALSILSVLAPEDLARAIAQEDVAVIERVPGIGRKGAQRMILELKGKLSDLSASDTYRGHQPAWREQLTSALVSLGFSPKDSDQAISALVNRMQSDGIDASTVAMSDLLKDALANGKSSRG